MKKTIILDTNALMAVGQFKIDVFSEIEKAADFNHEIRILDKTIEELEKIIREQKGKHREAAKLALEMIKKKGIKKIKTEKKKGADEALKDWAKKGAIIVTQDRELKKRIKEGGEVMVVRQKKRVAWG